MLADSNRQLPTAADYGLVSGDKFVVSARARLPKLAAEASISRTDLINLSTNY